MTDPTRQWFPPYRGVCKDPTPDSPSRQIGRCQRIEEALDLLAPRCPEYHRDTIADLLRECPLVDYLVDPAEPWKVAISVRGEWDLAPWALVARWINHESKPGQVMRALANMPD